MKDEHNKSTLLIKKLKAMFAVMMEKPMESLIMSLQKKSLKEYIYVE